MKQLGFPIDKTTNKKVKPEPCLRAEQQDGRQEAATRTNRSS